MQILKTFYCSQLNISHLFVNAGKTANVGYISIIFEETGPN